MTSGLSLVGQFDDIVRRTAPLTCGLEEEFIRFLQRRGLKHERSDALRKEIELLKTQLYKMMSEKDKVETKLKHTKFLVQTEIKKRMKVEADKKCLERQIMIIKEVLLADQQNPLNAEAREKLAFLSSTETLNAPQECSPYRLERIEESVAMLDSSEFSLDDSDDIILDPSPVLNLSRQKRSSQPRRSHGKKQRLDTLDQDTESADTGSVVVTTRYQHDVMTESDSSPVRTPFKEQWRSNKQALETIPKAPFVGFQPDSDVQFSDDQTVVKSTYPKTRLSSGNIDRKHVFVTKTIIRPEVCNICDQRIRFYKSALKCQECRITCHPECKKKIKTACFPVPQTPVAVKGPRATIADYAPKSSPMIPDILIHCINEIESRGLTEVGLYRISGSEKEVKDLKEKFLKGKAVPFLTRIDIHAICGTVKDFLRSLYEPLVTRNLWKDFVNAAGNSNWEQKVEACYRAISFLPQPNRDTLAFLLLHLHKVAESPDCKMPASNLAKVFGPTVVGYSKTDPSAADFSDTKHQFMVIELMLSLPHSYWRKFVAGGNVFSSLTANDRKATGINTRSRRGSHVEKGLLTPRGVLRSKSHRPQQQQYFSSPLLK